MGIIEAPWDEYAESRQSSETMHLYSPALLPTGQGSDTTVLPLQEYREGLGLPQRYRTHPARLRNWRTGKVHVQGPPPRLVPQAMSSLYAYMSLRGDPAVKGLCAASLLVLIHPWSDGNGRVSRRMYRAYNPEDGSSDHAVRSRLERKIREWGVFWHGPGE